MAIVLFQTNTPVETSISAGVFFYENYKPDLINRESSMSALEFQPEIILENEPSIERDGALFEGRDKSQFWIGKVSVEGVVERPDLFDAVARFRGDKYVRELQYLSEDHLDAEGREIDENDARSTQFGVFENLEGTEQVVGCGRLIEKRTAQDKLPVETHFPEIFDAEQARAGDVEISRFIAEHNDSLTQHKIGLSVIRSMFFYCNKQNIGTTFAIIERPLQGLLTSIGMPVETLGEQKEIPELGGTLIPISINPQSVIESLGERSRNTVLLRKFFEGEAGNNGLGYYPGELVGGINE